METLQSIIESATDKDGYVDMDKLLIKYSSGKTHFMINLIYEYIIKNKKPFKMIDCSGEKNFETILVADEMNNKIKRI